MNFNEASVRKKFQQKITQIFASKFPKKIAIALSGGSDSLALTLLLHEIALQKKCQLVAITVDHQMRRSSKNEAKKMAQFCAKRGIEHQILTLEKFSLPQANIEAELRQQRFEALHDFCLSQKISSLFLGHHQGDVAENFLIRLFRGSGLDGLAAMSEISHYRQIQLIRPLLNFSKNELQKYLLEKRISWIEDESNVDEKFLRNKIRIFLHSLPEHETIECRIKNSAEEIADWREKFDEELLRQVAPMLHFGHQGFFLLNQKSFKKLPEKMALKILSLLFVEVSGQFYKPRLEKLKRLYQSIVDADNLSAKSFYGCMIESVASSIFEPAELIAANKETKLAKELLVIYREKAAIDEESVQSFDDKNLLYDGRLLVLQKSLKKMLPIFPENSQLAKIKNLRGLKKKIAATALFRSSDGDLVEMKCGFYFRTIFKKLFTPNL